MNDRRRVGVVLVACAGLLAQAPSDAPDKTPSDFVRFVAAGGGGHLDTAITTYRNGDGVEVTLFGAVHIADQRCYETLNDRFTRCEVLLYELVAEADTRPQRGREREGFNPIALLQQGLKNSLELSFQLDAVDYSPANFVHADMTPAEFEASMAERGESLLLIMWRMMQQGMQRQLAGADAATEGKPAPFAAVDLVKSFRSGEGRHQLRMMFASQLEEMENMAAGLGNGDKGSTLLEGRNEKCLKVLQQQIAAGRRNLGVYYGAAHLPHMEKRLVEDLGFRKTGHEWLTAWDCAPRPDKKYDRVLVQLRSRCREELAVLIAAAREFRRSQAPEQVPTVAALAATMRQGQSWYAGPGQDPWGHDYVLRRRSGGVRWEAVSAGQDGSVGTDDDLVVIEPRGPVRSPADRATAAAADAAVPDGPILKAHGDARILRSAAARWLARHGTQALPTLDELHARTDDGHPWATGLQRDPWGTAWRIGWSVAPDWEVRSAGPDAVFDNADDVVLPMDRATAAAETAGKILAIAKYWRSWKGKDPTLAALLDARYEGKPILDVDGKDPWGHDFVVRVVRGRIEVASGGPDGEVGGADDVVVK